MYATGGYILEVVLTPGCLGLVERKVVGITLALRCSVVETFVIAFCFRIRRNIYALFHIGKKTVNLAFQRSVEYSD